MRTEKNNIPLYIKTANNIRSDIRSGLLVSGEIISQRKISERYGVSKKTVAEALDILQSEGLIIIKPRIGSFVNSNIWFPIAARKTPDWNGLIKNSVSVPSSGQIYSIYQFISSCPRNHIGGTSLSKDFNYHKPVKIGMERAIQRLGNTSDSYNMNIMGLMSLRESIAKHMKLRGIKCSINDILVTAGPMEALSLTLLSILRRGMKLFIEETSILGAPNFARFTGADIVRVACDEQGMIPDILIDKLHKAKSDAVVCLTPVNQYPTGSSLSKARRDLIMSACVSKDVPIIECDLMRDYNLGAYPRPFKSFDTNDLVIYIGSFISTYQNMKLGWIIAPPQIMKHIADTSTQYEININNVVQLIADEMLSSNAYSEYVTEYTGIFIERLRFCRVLFEKYFSDCARWAQDPLAFYQWLEFDKRINTYDLFKRLKDTFVHSGYFFNPNDIHRIYINPLRDSLQNLENGLKEISEIVHS